MTKKEIVKQIAEKYDEAQVKVKDIVQETFDLIVETLVTEGRIELRKFGVFEVKRRKPRRARNPRTNQPVDVQAKNVVTFQPGKVMEERVRGAKAVVESKRRATKPAARPAKPELPKLAEPDEEPVPVAVGGGDFHADEQDAVERDILPLKPR